MTQQSYRNGLVICCAVCDSALIMQGRDAICPICRVIVTDYHQAQPKDAIADEVSRDYQWSDAANAFVRKPEVKPP